jgi:hypothetical protein
VMTARIDRTRGRRSASKKEQCPVLYGRRITNPHEFINVQAAVMRDLLAGRISVKEANAVNRDSCWILKMFEAVKHTVTRQACRNSPRDCRRHKVTFPSRNGSTSGRPSLPRAISSAIGPALEKLAAIRRAK